MTTLADSGPGSFREGMAKGIYRIVFDVAGSINFESPIEAIAPVYIDGEPNPHAVEFKNHMLFLKEGSTVSHMALSYGSLISPMRVPVRQIAEA